MCERENRMMKTRGQNAMRHGRRVFLLLFALFLLAVSDAAAESYNAVLKIAPRSIVMLADDPDAKFEVVSGSAIVIPHEGSIGVITRAKPGGEITVRVTSKLFDGESRLWVLRASEPQQADFVAYRVDVRGEREAQYDGVINMEGPGFFIVPGEPNAQYEILSGDARLYVDEEAGSHGVELSSGEAVVRMTPVDNSNGVAQTFLLRITGEIPEQADAARFSEEILRLVNAERMKVGARPLQRLEDLTRVAAIRAEELPRRFSHTRPDGRDCFTAIKGRYRAAGENIAAGQRSPAEVMDSWMHSEGHRANILNPKYKSLGVGFYSDPHLEMKFYWVQLFTG